jgi:hypothetical protein
MKAITFKMQYPASTKNHRDEDNPPEHNHTNQAIQQQRQQEYGETGTAK